ncbi:MAG: hypothetical protein A2X86_06800 [Bdellovibrionales bacterium GWA2_49_15]|nr:MAG: hypothetical protein A2X86_06800 [Bdellovibrionales bacterium GWA2_49_15]HAZ12017.1 prephenate dehydrogenase/arogenate dehydrogenase family protein [Bdellovibrionales bacterium]
MNVGIIGMGRLGKLLARAMVRDFKVFVYDTLPLKNEMEKMGATWGDMATIATQDLIIPAVPISEFESVIRQLSPLLKPGSIVADVCSVKEHPAEIMQKYLPAHTSILATHPMFGPDSASDSFFARKLVLCPIRMEEARYQSIKRYLQEQGLTVIETTPAHHDEEISQSLLLAHFIGRGLIEYGAKDLTIDTKGYRRLMRILSTVENDTWQLFVDMNRYNRFAAKSRARFLSALTNIDQKVQAP